MRKPEIIPEYTDFVIEGGKLWYSSCLLNGLYSQSIETGEIEFVGLFPEEDFFRENLFRCVVLVDRELIFVPCDAKHISTYHIDHKCFAFYDVPDAERWEKYVSAVFIDGRLYLFPANARKAIAFDVEKKQVVELKRFNEKLTSLLRRAGSKFYLAGTAKLGDSIYLAVKDTNRLIQYFYREEKLIEHVLDFDGENLGGIAVNQDSVFIGASGKEQMMCLSSNKKEKLFYHLDDSREKKEERKIEKRKIEKVKMERTGFPVIKCYGTDIFLHYVGDSILYKLDLTSMETGKIRLTEEEGTAYLMKLEGKELFFLPYRGCSMCRYSIEEGKIYQMPKVSPQVWDTMRRKGLQSFLSAEKGVLFYENKKISLEDFLESVPDFNNCMWKNQAWDLASKKICGVLRV